MNLLPALGLAALAVPPALHQAAAAERPASREVDPPEPCDPGVWDVTSRSFGPGGAVATRQATSSVICLFDGAVEMAEYRDLAPDGSVLFRGVSFHAWNRSHTERTTLWLMLMDPGYTLLAERMQEGVLASEGLGPDRAGHFVETSLTTFDDADGYRFEMNRSYDDGATWLEPFNVIDAVRRTAESPSPVEPTDGVRAAKAAVGATSEGRPVLDGLAEVAVHSETVGGRTRRTIRFSSRYPAPDRWRTVTWEVGELEVSVAEERIDAEPRRDSTDSSPRAE